MEKTVGNATLPAIGLGTWQLRGRNCITAVEEALELGYRHIDTAQMYGNEAAVGAGLQNTDVAREEVFLTTKVWRDSLQADAVRRTVTASLDRLGVEYVDLLLIHWPNQDIAVAETLGAMQALQDDGKVAHIGVSNFSPELLDEALDIAQGIICNQVEMHPFYRQRELVDYCDAHDLFLTAYSPLARGQVVGDKTLQRIAEKHEATAAQVALSWLLQHDPVITIPKAASTQHQKENLAAAELKLDADDVERINGIEQRSKIV